MSSPKFSVRKAAVLGAGVMGAQIAAHLANANVPVDPVRPRRQGRRPERHRAARRSTASRSSSPRRSRPRTASRCIDAANYDEHLALLAGVRPRHRGDRRAHGLEEGPLREGRAAPRAARDLRHQHLGAVDQRARRRRCPTALRTRFCGIHFFNPPRYMHLVELIADADDRPGAARRARDLPHDDARQGRDPRQGHAELRRQPRRRLLDAGDDAPHASVRARLRRGRRADRPGDRPRRRAPPTAPPTSSASTRWRTSSRRCRTRCPTIRGTRYYQAPAGARGADRARARSGRRRKAGFFRKKGKDIQVLDLGRAGLPRRPPARSPTEVAAILKDEAARRAVRASCARSRTRRRSSCGRSSATSSTTARTPGRRSPTTRATSISRSAGASAGRWGRSRLWQAAGWQQVAGWIAEDIAAGKTHGATCRCRRG